MYDNLDRLTKVYRGATALLRMRYEGNKGGITTKSDIGVLGYNRPDKPYVVSQIDSCSQLTPSSAQTITYTSFESVGTISENNYIASFTYNAENERAKMVVQQGGSTILTRWYPSSNFIKETAGSTTKEYTFIGGDAYTAPCVAIKQGTSTKFYYILRDYLGSITQIVDTVKNILYKYNYDVWGRIRRDTTWVNYSPGQEPDLFIAGRGFTGHEHLKWFNLINMNGRLYDPLTGQFVSADNFIQAPGYTQSYNRFGYCLNNPLKYTDPTGEDWNTWLIAGIIGAVSNVIAHWDDINGDFIKFNQYAFVGLVAGSTSAAMMESGIGAPAAGMCGGGILNSGNAYIQGARGYDLIEANTQGMIAGGISGFAISGLSELLKIPINVKTHSGLVEPGTLKPQTAQISLGDWLFGSRSSQIDNIINSQGATNAAQLLPPNVRSLDLGLLPKPSLRSMYENSSLEFMGNLTNYTKGRQYVDGLLMWVNHYADGSISVTDTWVAISGPWDDIISLGDHTIRNGFMGENTGLISYQRSGSDFYIDIFPNPRYEIHPDGNTWGTNGCIGVHDTGPRLNNLFNIIKSYVGRNNELQLNVIY